MIFMLLMQPKLSVRLTSLGIVGDVFQFGEVVLQVTQSREFC